MRELSLLAAAEEHPARTCLIAHGERHSFAEVAPRVRAAVGWLRARGVGPGDRVAVTPGIDVDSLIWLYALFELAAPAVLLHPRLTDRERAAILHDAKPVHVVDRPAPDEPIEAGPSSPRPSGEDTLAVVFTSGSSGASRGALLSRRAFVASEAAHAAHLGWQDGDRWVLCLPLAHVGGLSIVTRTLIARRCVVLGPPAFEPSELMRVLRRDRVTLCSLVPTMLRRLLDLDPMGSPPTTLRALLVGGAHFPDALRKRAADRGLPALATYGCTEACSQVTTQRIEQRGTPGSGTPLPGIDVRVEAGEIQVRGPVLMDGYLGDDPSPSWRTSDGWLRTGDSGSWLDDGQLSVHGRLDELIVTGGENVVPFDVEAWLETVPGIDAACVFAVPSDDWGQEVAAAIVVDPRVFDATALEERLRSGLAPHKRPKQICILDAMPRNRTGKVDRPGVRAECAGRLRPI